MGEERIHQNHDDDDQVFDCGFLELLGCKDDGVFEEREGLSFSPLYSSSYPPQMLSFGGVHDDFLPPPPPPPPPLLSATAPSSSSCAAAAAAGRSRARSATAKKVENNGGGGRKPTKPRAAGPAGAIKVRKEKLGERISVLQQLVSPFGKTDTATVLHEAIGYIRFLHDQVQVLSSPYLHQLQTGEEHGELRSRGLCLVPVSCTENVANSNKIGADFWSPAAAAAAVGGSSSSSSGSKH